MLATTNQNKSIAVIQNQPRFTEVQIQTIKDTICKGATNEELQLFMAVTERTGLDPFARQIFSVKRKEKQSDGTYKEVMSIQISIDGFRLIAARTGKYRGQVGAYWCGKDGLWKDVWLEDEPPMAAKVGVLHADFKEPLFRVAKFWSYAQITGYGDKQQLNHIWKKFPELMIAKCAEALALRSAFPQELSGLYSPDEMGNPEIQEQPMQAQVIDISAQSTVDLERKSLSDRILVLMQELKMKKEDAQGIMRQRYFGKSTRDQMSLDDLKDFVNYLESLSNDAIVDADEDEIPFN